MVIEYLCLGTDSPNIGIYLYQLTAVKLKLTDIVKFRYGYRWRVWFGRLDQKATIYNT